MIDFSKLKEFSINGAEIFEIRVNGELYWKKVIESLSSYTNLLPLATSADRKTIYNDMGYKAGTRLSSSGSDVAFSGKAICASGFIKAKVGDIVRFKNFGSVSGTACYLNTYNSSNTLTKSYAIGMIEKPHWADVVSSNPNQRYDFLSNTLTIKLTSEINGSDFDSFRISGVINESTIVTINEEIPHIFNYNENWIRHSINQNGTLYGTNGLKVGYRVRSGGEEATNQYAVCTGFIPFRKGVTVEITPAFTGQNVENAINFYTLSKGCIGQVTSSGSLYNMCTEDYLPENVGEKTILRFKDVFHQDLTYIRITHHTPSMNDTTDFIVRVIDSNEKNNRKFTNVLPLSLDKDLKTLYNVGVGFKENLRWSASDKNEVVTNGAYLSGYIPYNGEIIRIKNAGIVGPFDPYIVKFDHSGNYISVAPIKDCLPFINSEGIFRLNHTGYIRLSCNYINMFTIITLDEQISNQGISYTNLIPSSVDKDGSVYNNGKGYKENTRFSSSSNADVSSNGITVTGYIPVKRNSKIMFKGLTFRENGENYSMFYISKGSDKSNLVGTYISSYFNDTGNDTYCLNVSLDYFTAVSTCEEEDLFIRFSCDKIDENSIVVADEFIE